MSADTEPVRMTVDPPPTDVEMAVILAAFDQLWPDDPETEARRPASTTWRFSGRWWADQRGRRAPVTGWR